MADEWRVEVELTDEDGQVSLGEALEAADLDSEAERRLGGRVLVTHDGPHVFLYSADETGAREAERVAAALVADHGLDGRVALTRWHPDEQSWKDASEPLPASAAERDAEHEALRAAELEELRTQGRYDWEVRVELPGHGETVELADRLREQGLAVTRRWRYLLVGALTEQDAAELAERIREQAPQGSEVRLDANLDEPTHPLFVFLRARI